VECILHTDEVTSSNLVAPTTEPRGWLTEAAVGGLDVGSARSGAGHEGCVKDLRGNQNSLRILGPH
ncbi:MAG: hypothetical protein AAGA56_17900, partial [Myxococcota bacterium]